MHPNPKVIFLVIICITAVTITALGLGTWLSVKGYEGGGVLISTGSTGLGGLIALLSSTRSNAPVEVVNQPGKALETTETK